MPKGLKGFQKGQKFTESHLRKLSESKKSNFQFINNLIKRNKARRGIRLSDSHRKKISIGLIGTHTQPKSEECKKKISQSKKGSIPWNKGRKFEQYSKENHWNWKGGISRGYRKGYKNDNKYKQWRINVFQRDNWTCQNCNMRGTYLEPHHIKSWARFPELRYELDNGVTLCKECHKLTDNYKGKKS